MSQHFFKILACGCLFWTVSAVMELPSAYAQSTKAPVRDPQHTTQKYPCHYKQLKEVHVVMQTRDYSCGAAALATVLKYYWDDNVTEEQVLEAIGKILSPDEMKDRVKNGLAISDIRRAAVDMGYLSTIGTLSFEDLSKSKVPLVVGISYNKYDHFVVCRGVNCEWIYLADPIRGNIRMNVCDFVSQWQKNAVLVVAKPDQEPPEHAPLSIHTYEINRGELNYQVFRTLPTKIYSAR